MAANPPTSDHFRYSGILPSTHGRLFAPGVAGNHTSTRLIPDDTLIMGEKLPEDPTSLSDDASRESPQSSPACCGSRTRATQRLYGEYRPLSPDV